MLTKLLMGRAAGTLELSEPHIAQVKESKK